MQKSYIVCDCLSFGRDYKDIIKLISQNISQDTFTEMILAKDSYGKTPLDYSTTLYLQLAGWPTLRSLAEKLLEYNVTVETYSPLEIAVLAINTDRVIELLQNTDSPPSIEACKKSLEYALYYGRSDIALMIFNNKKDSLDLKNIIGQSLFNCLHTAGSKFINHLLSETTLDNSYKTIIEKLFNADISPYGSTRELYSPILISNMTEAMYRHFSKFIETTLIDFAIKSNYFSIIKALAENFQEPTANHKYLNKLSTALQNGIDSGKIDVSVANVLVGKVKLSNNATSIKWHKSQLDWAISKGHYALAEILVKQVPTEYGHLYLQSSTLHWAMKNNNEIAKAMIEKMSDAQLVEKDKDGNTPLHYAVTNNQNEIVKALCARLTPPQVAIKNDQGKSPLAIAIASGFNYIVKLLTGRLATDKKIQVDLYDGYIESLKNNNEPVRKCIFNAIIADPSKRDSQGNLPLIRLGELQKQHSGLSIQIGKDIATIPTRTHAQSEQAVTAPVARGGILDRFRRRPGTRPPNKQDPLDIV